ncbi:MAG: hypothetical protein QOJ20_2505 [Mycobacterium sp.]|jgi:dGTP triphosphohydrolase|nr:hypothetical protein [Mycobacterium sp.]
MYVQRTQCDTDPRSPSSEDLVRRVTDYVAGYSDARADAGHAD